MLDPVILPDAVIVDALNAARLVALETFNVPATTVLPVAASTVNFVSATSKSLATCNFWFNEASPCTSNLPFNDRSLDKSMLDPVILPDAFNVPATIVLPLAAATVNLSVFTTKSLATPSFAFIKTSSATNMRPFNDKSSATISV